MMHRLVLSSVVAVSALFAAGCGGPKVYPLNKTGISAVKDDAELVARGEYLFHGAAHCSACHTTGEQGAAIKGGDRPAPTGGHVWKMGPLGTLYSPNITSDEATGVGKWSDDDVARMIKHGQRPDGTMGVFMRFALGEIADDDIKAIVTYMRTLPAVSNQVPPHEIGFLGKMVLGDLAPRPDTKVASVPVGATVERGRYLAHGPAVCVGCHSEADGFDVKKGREFVGADSPMPSEFDDDPNAFLAPNLTSDPSGITGKWTEEQFVARFKEGRQHRGSAMPWGNYQNLQDDDIKSLYMYLKTVPPAKKDYPATVVPK
jgi:mono/diheme cytochrome c family protein